MTILRRTRPRTAASASALSIVVGVLCTSAIPDSSHATEPVPIAWRDDYGGAMEEARAGNRPVWIQFTGPWCPNCLRMERDSFPDADIIEHSQQSFVPLRLRSDVHEQLALSFNLSGLPATVLVAPTREILAIRQGYLGPDELDQVLSEGLATWRGREAAKAREAKADAAARGKTDSPKAKEEPKPALSGYCPVSLVADRKLVAGQAEHTVRHEGRAYRFASPAMGDMFRKDPDRYVPSNRGDCPVAQVDRNIARPGDPRWGVLYQGRLFLCSSPEDRRRFLGDPGRYAMVDVAEQGFCAHCLAESGLLVRGDPKCGLTRYGLRYWFPAPSHRAAFLAAHPAAAEPSTTEGPTATTASR